MKKSVYYILAAISITGGFCVYFATALGPWVGSDSVNYLVAAENLLQGYGLNLLLPNGLYHPSTMQPPLYSFSLALMYLMGFQPLDAARWLSILFMMATIMAAGVGLYRLTSSSMLAITTVLVITASPIIQSTYYAAMSDSLAVLLTVCALLSLTWFLKKHSALSFALFVISSSLMILTRYIALAILPTGFLLILLGHQSPWPRRIKLSFLYVGLVFIMILPWMIHSYTATGTLTDRDPVNLSNPWAALTGFRLGLVNGIWSWLPFRQNNPIKTYRLELFVLIALFLIFFSITAILIRRKWKSDQGEARNIVLIPVVSLSYVVVFVLTFIAAFLFTKPTPDVDNRTLLPMSVGLVLAFFSTLWLWAQASGTQKAAWLKLLPVLVCALVLADYVPTSLRLITTWHAYSSWNCANPGWQNSELVAVIRKLPASTRIIANEEACFYFYTGRRPYDLRNIRISDTQDVKRFGDDLSDPLQVVFHDRQAVLVITFGFDQYLESRYGGNGAKLIEALTAGLIANPYHDGTIYFYP